MYHDFLFVVVAFRFFDIAFEVDLLGVFQGLIGILNDDIGSVLFLVRNDLKRPSVVAFT